jgi:hypothetical protein
MSARASAARASELIFIANQTRTPSLVMEAFRRTPRGGRYSDSEIEIEWGNIHTLVESAPRARKATCLVTNSARHIYHLDRLGRARLAEVERKHHLVPGSITGGLSDTKADVLIIDKSGKSFLISYKEKDGVAKLGQVSKSTKYGRASLAGGFALPSKARTYLPHSVDVRDTELSLDQFRNIGANHQRLAYLKSNFPTVWSDIVNTHIQDATSQVSRFCRQIADDRSSFIEFIGSVFAGNQKRSANFFIVFEDKKVQLNEVIHELQNPKWKVDFVDASTRAKHATLVTVNNSQKKYSLMRIEHSFEGSKATVAQTKGIIFHFQQAGEIGTNYKQLLIDLG